MSRAVLLVIVLTACGGAQRAATTTDEVAALREAWARAFNAKQLDPVIATYALDAVVMPITGGRIVSSAAIRNLYQRIWQQFTPPVELNRHVVERSGDPAYESGEYVASGVAGGTAGTIP